MATKNDEFIREMKRLGMKIPKQSQMQFGGKSISPTGATHTLRAIEMPKFREQERFTPTRVIQAKVPERETSTRNDDGASSQEEGSTSEQSAINNEAMRASMQKIRAAEELKKRKEAWNKEVRRRQAELRRRQEELRMKQLEQQKRLEEAQAVVSDLSEYTDDELLMCLNELTDHYTEGLKEPVHIIINELNKRDVEADAVEYEVIETDGEASTSAISDFLSKIDGWALRSSVTSSQGYYGASMPLSAEESVDILFGDFQKKYSGVINEDGWEESNEDLKYLQNYYDMSDDDLLILAEEYLRVMYGDSYDEVFADSPLSPLEHIFASGDMIEDAKIEEKTRESFEDEKLKVQNADLSLPQALENSQESASKAIFEAINEGTDISELITFADEMAQYHGIETDNNDPLSSLTYYLTWKDPEITAVEKVGGFFSNAWEGFESAYEGIATSAMKLVGMDAFVPQLWTKADWGQHMIGDIREEMSGVGGFLYDIGYTAGNMVPSMIANAALPGSGMVVIFAQSAGETYNASIMQGFSEEEATAAGFLTATLTSLIEAFTMGAGKLGGKISSSLGKKATGEITEEGIEAAIKQVAMKAAKIPAILNVTKAFFREGTGEFAEEYIESMLNPLVENLAYKGEEYNFKDNPIEIFSSEHLYNGLMGLVMGGTVGAVHSDVGTAVKDTIKSNLFGTEQTVSSGTITDTTTSTFRQRIAYAQQVRVSGEALGVSDKQIRYAQDVAMRYGIKVEFTQSQTGYDADTNTIRLKQDVKSVSAEVQKVISSNADAIRHNNTDLNGDTEFAKMKFEQMVLQQMRHRVPFLEQSLSSMNDNQLRTIMMKYGVKYGFELLNTVQERTKYLHNLAETKHTSQMKDTILKQQSELGFDAVRTGSDVELQINEDIDVKADIDPTVSEESLVGEGESDRIETEERSAGSETEAIFYQQISEIGCDPSLTDQQKVDRIQQAYHALEEKGDVTIPADIAFLQEQAFDEYGYANYNWPAYLGFVKESIQSITRESGMNISFTRTGGSSGNNFSTLKQDGSRYTNDELGLPYLDNPDAVHDFKINDTYFDVIDAIHEGSLEKLNKILKANRVDNISQVEFENLKIDYDDFLRVVEESNVDVDAVYGMHGIVQQWKSQDGVILLNGGGVQLTIPFSIESLIKFGVVESY